MDVLPMTKLIEQPFDLLDEKPHREKHRIKDTKMTFILWAKLDRYFTTFFFFFLIE
jgi:hypothetical protein